MRSLVSQRNTEAVPKLYISDCCKKADNFNAHPLLPCNLKKQKAY